MNNFLINSVNTIYNSLLRCILPIFSINDIKKEVIGSATLLKYGSNFYLITAAHVISELDENSLNIYSNDIFYKITEGILFIQSSKNDYDNVDIALIKLSDKTVNFLKNRHIFVDLTKLDNNVYSDYGYAYLFIGFPNSRNQFRYLIETEPLPCILNECTDLTYDKMKRKKSNDFILEINKNGNKNLFSLKDESLTIPKLNGISGCGVWLIGDFKTESSIGFTQPIPIGIVREVNYMHNALMVTRYQYALEAFKKIEKEMFK